MAGLGEKLVGLRHIMKNYTSCLLDAKFEELEEKYKKKVQENKELELQLRTIQLKVSIS